MKLWSIVGYFLLPTVFSGGLPFQNPITKTIMQNNDGKAIREIMETLEERGEVCETLKLEYSFAS